MTIFPKVLPDEFVLGYWGRIHLLNTFPTSEDTINALIEQFNPPAGGSRRFEALACSANLNNSEFAQNHSLIPSLLAMTSNKAGMLHSLVNTPAVIRRNWRLLQKPAAYFCPACAEFQQSQWGFSYWMRRHQLLGVDWCVEHGTSLRSCDESAFMRKLPSHIGDSVLVAEPVVNEISKPILKRYSQIMVALLRGRLRVNLSDAGNIVRPLAMAKGLSTRQLPTSQYLSDYAVDVLPISWLKKLFPKLEMKQANEKYTPLDNTVLAVSARTHAYALAMALLYESSEAALTALYQQAGRRNPVNLN